MSTAKKRTPGAVAFKAFLTEKGLSQKAASLALKVTDVAIHEWVTGGRRPRSALRASIAIWTHGRVTADMWDAPNERRSAAAVQPFDDAPAEKPTGTG